MRVDRLERMAGFLEALEIPKNGRFLLDDWENPLADPQCGTAACAVGWALIRDVFAKDGLVMEYERPQKTGDRYVGVPVFEGQRGWDAVEAFFEISEATSGKFFVHRSNNRFKHQVTANIRKHIARHGPKQEAPKAPKLRIVA